VIYFDTSALAKKYLKKEKGRGKVIELLESNPQHLVSSALTNLEILSALTRRQREISGFDKALQSFSEDWESFIVWTIDDSLIGSAAALIRIHRLKAADAIHLATACSIRKHIKDRLLFVSSDQELLTAADKEGLLVLDPETEG
jgi:predicted nucleic acid-binding protein